MENHSLFLTSNREAVAWIIVVIATAGLAFPFLLLRVWYLLIFGNKKK